jgi:CheY-like chemotaxis protein
MPVLTKRSRQRVIFDTYESMALAPPTDEIPGSWTGGNRLIVAPAGQGPLRILIIDDNWDAADSLAILVKIWGHDANVAYDGAAALAMATDDLPDVLFIDIGMPKMNGFRLAQHLRRQSRFADCLLVAVTGWADEPHRRLWEEAFDHYLIKPVDPPALEILLRDRCRIVRSRVGGELWGSPALGLVAASAAGRSPSPLVLC